MVLIGFQFEDFRRFVTLISTDPVLTSPEDATKAAQNAVKHTEGAPVNSGGGCRVAQVLEQDSELPTDFCACPQIWHVAQNCRTERWPLTW